MTTIRRSGGSEGVARGITLVVGAAIAALIAMPAASSASTDPGLGTAASFAVLAGTPAITNTGASVISGSMGIFPAAAVTGFPPGTVINGTIEAATVAAGTAKSDLTAAYGVAAASPCNFDETGQNLGGLTLTPGTYCQTTAPTLTGTLTLSGDGVFIFQIGSTLVTAPGATVLLTDGAQACNVYWQVSSSATLDTTTTFVGTIMALTDISVNNGVTVTGRALARNGEVTLINDEITVPSACTAPVVSGPTPSATPTPALGPAPTPTPVPIPGTPTTGGAASTPFHGTALIVIGISFLLASGGVGVSVMKRRRNVY